MTIKEYIEQAFEDYDNEVNAKMNWLQGRINQLEKERRLICDRLREGQIDLLKEYLL